MPTELYPGFGAFLKTALGKSATPRELADIRRLHEFMAGYIKHLPAYKDEKIRGQWGGLLKSVRRDGSFEACRERVLEILHEAPVIELRPGFAAFLEGDGRFATKKEIRAIMNGRPIFGVRRDIDDDDDDEIVASIHRHDWRVRLLIHRMGITREEFMDRANDQESAEQLMKDIEACKRKASPRKRGPKS